MAEPEKHFRSLIASAKKEITEYSIRPIGRGLKVIEKIDKCDLLVVDDEPSFRSFLVGYFRHMIPRIKIKLAKDGEEAYDLALEFRPRIIWTCIRMPHMDGFELIESIKKNPDIRNAKIIIYTAYHSEEIKNQAFELGADAFLPKGNYEQLEEGVKIVTNFLK